MKKIILKSIIFFSLLTGCSKKIENQFITVEAKDDEIIISKDYVESFKTKFQNWNGPIE